jgi:hypothetical protein
LGGVHMMQNGNRRTELSRREWMLALKQAHRKTLVNR